MYWTKNGSIPSQETDGTDGWQQAPSPPTEIPEGKELVWLNWEWIVRDPKPADRSGWQWNWNHADRAWVESAWQTEGQSMEFVEPVEIPTLTTSQISNLTTAQVM
jgi:hypothetical protein